LHRLRLIALQPPTITADDLQAEISPMQGFVKGGASI